MNIKKRIKSISIFIYINTYCAFLHIIEPFLRYFPSVIGTFPLGIVLRRLFYKTQGVKMGKNVKIMEGVFIFCGQGLKMGNNITIAANTMINARGGVTIGDDVLIGPGTYIWSQNHDFTVSNMKMEERYILKPVHIGNNVWIGANSKIIPGVKIGDGVVIGMGSVVTKDVLPGHLVIGNPIQDIGYLG